MIAAGSPPRAGGDPGRIVVLVLTAVLITGCSRTGAADQNAGEQLEQAAIAAGVVRDPADTNIAGLYARDTDRVCIVPARVGYRIGATVDYGNGQGCSGAGTVSRTGETLRIDFNGAPGCSFDARLDGETIAFPGRLPAPCDRLCARRASLSALEADRQSDAVAEAAALRDAGGRTLCGG